jgi:hypothetical protein
MRSEMASSVLVMHGFPGCAGRICVGTSGWIYKDWAISFYPALLLMKMLGEWSMAPAYGRDCAKGISDP